jgi:hypothetical protein
LKTLVSLAADGDDSAIGRSQYDQASTHRDATVCFPQSEFASPILKGRAFRSTDSSDSSKVAIVNSVFAERYWPGADPIGKRFRVDNSSGPWVEVIGVAKASKYGFLIERPTEFVYFPYRQRPAQSMFLLAQSIGVREALCPH